jgi:DNA-binding MarR family transcriptional regulator
LRFPGLDGIRPTELARRLETSKQAVNPFVNDLERWRCLERRPDPDDKCGRVLWFTDRGRELMATIKGLHAEIEADWSRELGSERFQVLRSALHDLIEAEQIPRQ